MGKEFNRLFQQTFVGQEHVTSPPGTSAMKATLEFELPGFYSVVRSQSPGLPYCLVYPTAILLTMFELEVIQTAENKIVSGADLISPLIVCNVSILSDFGVILPSITKLIRSSCSAI